jgi:hypothetical protein
MAFRGRYQVGQKVPLGCFCIDANGVPTPPAAAPTMDIFSPANALIISADLVPIVDPANAPGYFQQNWFLTSYYTAVGLYTVIYHWVIGSAPAFQSEDTFEVVDGGNYSGSIIALHYHDRPWAQNLIYQMDGGNLAKGRNPGV